MYTPIVAPAPTQQRSATELEEAASERDTFRERTSSLSSSAAEAANCTRSNSKLYGAVHQVSSLRIMASSSAPTHVVFLQGSTQGHINPTIPLVAALRERGCQVTYFADAHVQGDAVHEGTPLGKAVLATGATLRPYAIDPLLKKDPRFSGVMYENWQKLPGLLEDLRALQPAPSIILYDPFAGSFAAAARIIGVPYIGLVPHCGPGFMDVAETDKAIADAHGVREWLTAEHGLDLMELGLPPLSWYAPKLNLVLTCEELFAPLSTDEQRRIFSDGCFRCVGTMNVRAADRFLSASMKTSAC